MSSLRRSLGIAAAVCLAAGPAPAQSWSPTFQLSTPNPYPAPGGTFQVDVFFSGVGGNVAGYQIDLVYDAARVSPVTVTQGPYLMFSIFLWTLTPSSPPYNRIPIGALNIPPVALPPGTGSGLAATVTFAATAPGSAYFDLTSSNLVTVLPGVSVYAIRRDLLAQVMAPGEILGVSGPPHAGSTLSLDLMDPAHTGAQAITALGLTNCCIPIPGAGTVPLGYSFLVDLAIQNLYPYTNANAFLDATGRSTCTVAIPASLSLLPLTLHAASVVLVSGGVVISNGVSFPLTVP